MRNVPHQRKTMYPCAQKEAFQCASKVLQKAELAVESMNVYGAPRNSSALIIQVKSIVFIFFNYFQLPHHNLISASVFTHHNFSHSCASVT